MIELAGTRDIAFTLMSAVGYFLCGISQTLGEVFVYRILSEAGGTMPVAISMILDVVQDPAREGSWAGASIGMAFTLGLVGGAVAYVAGKRAGFCTHRNCRIVPTAFFGHRNPPSAGILANAQNTLMRNFKATKDVGSTGNETKFQGPFSQCSSRSSVQWRSVHLTLCAL